MNTISWVVHLVAMQPEVIMPWGKSYLYGVPETLIELLLLIMARARFGSQLSRETIKLMAVQIRQDSDSKLTYSIYIACVFSKHFHDFFFQNFESICFFFESTKLCYKQILMRFGKLWLGVLLVQWPQIDITC